MPSTDQNAIAFEARRLEQNIEFFFKMMRQLAAEKPAGEIAKMCSVLETYLGVASGAPLTLEQRSKLKTAWLAYLATCPPPSKSLTEAFAHFRKVARSINTQHTRPPSEIADVFDSMLATDAELAQRSMSDHNRVRAKSSLLALLILALTVGVSLLAVIKYLTD